jgi:hypothetical protein
MAHYAKLDEENNVIRVNVVNNSDCLNADGIEDEEVGRQFLERIHNWPLWKKTSYNTKRGQYFELDEEGVPVLAEDQSKAFRKNFANAGMIYIPEHDLFTIKKPFPSWTLNTTSGIWESPVAEPTLSIPDHEQGFRYQWNESLGQWEKVQ